MRCPSQKLLVALILATLAVVSAEPAFARTYQLWGGQASFKLPPATKVKITPADKKFGDECLVTPSAGVKNVFGMVAREKLSGRERTMPFRDYAQRLKAGFLEAQGMKALRFSADQRRQRVVIEVAGRLPDWVPVPLERPKNAKVLGYFISYRSGNYSFGAFAMTTSKSWKNLRVAPYRKLVDSLRIRK